MTQNISMQLQALGAAKPIDCTIHRRNNCNLMSLGMLVIDEGFSFYWTHGGLPHLVAERTQVEIVRV